MRSFAPVSVEDEKVEAILEAASVAPTACNFQPQKIFVIRSPEALEKLRAVCSCTFGAQLVFAVGYDPARSAKGRVRPGHDFGDTDAAIVCTHMMLAAQSVGLGSCWVGRFVEQEVREALGIPEEIRICDLLPVGYPAPDAKPAALHSTFRPREEIVEER